MGGKKQNKRVRSDRAGECLNEKIIYEQRFD